MGKIAILSKKAKLKDRSKLQEPANPTNPPIPVWEVGKKDGNRHTVGNEVLKVPYYQLSTMIKKVA